MQSKNVENLFNEYKENLIKGLQEVRVNQLLEFVKQIEKMAQTGATLFIMGNGGSAATASHFANDLFSLNLKIKDFNLKTECLCDNTSVITALGNDISFDDIFMKQLEVKANPGDAVLILSASGNSKNLVKAVEWAKNEGLSSLSITGFDGGRVNELSDYPIHIPSEKGEYEKSEDLHLFINHFMRFYIQKKWS